MNAGARRENLLEPQRHRDTEGHREKLMMTHARGRASKCTLWPSVSLCLCGSKNPFLLGKDLQISSIGTLGIRGVFDFFHYLVAEV
jgi:hypothetical protein